MPKPKSSAVSTEVLLATAIDGLEEHFVLFDEEDRIALANKAWKKMNQDILEFTEPGITFEDHLRAAIKKGLIPESEGREEEWLRERMEKHRNPQGSFELARQDGQWFLVSEQRLPNNATILIISDITERKLAEQDLRDRDACLSGIMDNVIDGIVTIDEKGIIESVNRSIEYLFGYSEGELIGENVKILMPEPDCGRHDTYLADYLRTGQGKILGIGPREVTGQHKNGANICLELATSEMRLGAEMKFIGVLRDITKRKQVEQELRKLSRAVESSSSGVIITDLDGTIEYINEKFTEITGYSREEVIGQNTRILQSGETPDKVYVEMWENIATGGEWKGECRNRKKDGSLYWAHDSISAVKDETGVITHYISMQDDVTHELELKQQLSYQASHDDLTGLINRNEFERRVDRLLSTVQQEKGEHALCIMDIDQFKVINDTCGHIAGDELLRQLGRTLQTVVRRRDTLARLGGDEFGILVEHCSLEQAQRVANALRQDIQAFQFSWEGQPFRIGVSIGMVAINETTPNFTELLKQADAACYMAKDLGRNRIHTYHPEDTDLAQRHGEMQWVNRINQALDDNRFCLYAQAIVPLDGSDGTHYELLLRMVDEQGKIIPPGAFLPAAERYDLIGKLDVWVVQNAFTLLAAHPEFLKQVHFISINLSGPSLTNGVFLNTINTQLLESGIDASKICFEITETVAISNFSAALTFIDILKLVGCRFALDDFGSGLSSFGYLKKLPVDYLKIDGVFVKDIVEDPIDRAMVKSINDVGQVMGMQTIAEFVETDEIKSILEEIGVNYAQGYGIEKPRPLDELLSGSKTYAGSPIDDGSLS